MALVVQGVWGCLCITRKTGRGTLLSGSWPCVIGVSVTWQGNTEKRRKINSLQILSLIPRRERIESFCGGSIPKIAVERDGATSVVQQISFTPRSEVRLNNSHLYPHDEYSWCVCACARVCAYLHGAMILAVGSGTVRELRSWSISTFVHGLLVLHQPPGNVPYSGKATT
jgi:hypothetical protein